MIQTYDGLDALPKSLRIYGASDYATMAPKAGKKEPDFSEHGIWGMDQRGELWAVDWWNRQCETDVSIAQFIRMVRLWKPLRWFDEGGLIEKAIGPTVRKSMRDARAFVAIESLPSLVDKGIRLQAFHAMATAGAIHFPVKRPWADRVIEQLVKFPAGRWDDAADVCGLIGRGVDLMYDAQVPVRDTKPLLVPFTEKWIEFNAKGDKPPVRYF
jgi:predicted phage terminase large subunit-like protein